MEFRLAEIRAVVDDVEDSLARDARHGSERKEHLEVWRHFHVLVQRFRSTPALRPYGVAGMCDLRAKPGSPIGRPACVRRRKHASTRGLSSGISFDNISKNASGDGYHLFRN